MLQPKSMQQIAILIITFLVYVKGIRNGGSSMQHNYESSTSSYSEPYMDANSFFPSQPLTQMAETLGNAARQSSGFRPSQILDFTTSDAAELHNFPPTYVDANYPPMIPRPTQSIAMRYVMEKQFSFPNEQQQQLQAAPSNAYNYNYQPQTNTPSVVPTQLQSTPILTYRDPFTNENYHHTPTPSSTAANNQRRPQDYYTVQSSLMVGNSGSNKFGAYQQASNPANEYQRPGYVFDEQVSPSYERPVYTQSNNKYSQYQSMSQQHPNAITPNYNRELPGQANRPPPPTSRPQASEHLSYDSHDYPPPSYFQQQQQSTNFQSPQRQDTANYASSSSPNYANNFGNYLQGEEYMGNYQRPPTSPNYSNNSPQYGSIQRPQSRPPPPSHNNYNEYQQGEVPPPPSKPTLNYPPNYRPPPYRPTSSQQQPSGLASLASLFTSTQQYAPQFTNLLLGGGGGSSSASNPLGSILGALTGGTTNSGGGGGGYGSRPSPANNMQLIKALENIARNDDLQCVPKVLCQMIAGQTQRGQLPSFITSPAITNFLAGFPAASPALIYGRAALLGISGGEISCTQTYTQCPKNEFEILHYLNNHRGGFFKFFSEPEEHTATHQGSNGGGSGGGGGATSLFSILSALTGGGNSLSVPTTTTPRPKPRPTPASSSDITSGIGSFFTNVLSEYLGGGVEYQRRRRRRSLDNYKEEIEADIEQETETEKSTDSEDFHDEEDDEDTQNGVEFEDSSEQSDDVEGRILHKEVHALNEAKFFPTDEGDREGKQQTFKNIIKNFNKVNAERKLKFPSDSEVRVYDDVEELENPQVTEEGDEDDGDSRRGKRIQFKDDDMEYSNAQRDYETTVNFIENDSTLRDSRRGKKVIFKDATEDQSSQHSDFNQAIVVEDAVDNEEPQRGGRVIFPDHYNSLIRKGRILNRPSYAATYVDYVRTNQDDQDRFVVSNSHRKPYYQSSTGSSVDSNKDNYNTAYYSQSSNAAQNSFSANSQSSTNYVSSNYNGGSSNNNRYYTPSSATNSNSNYNKNHNNNYNYPNNNYVSNNRYSSNYQTARTTRRPQQDDKNVYVTNSHGITEYYLTPDGRKVYL